MGSINISIKEFRGFIFNELPYYFEEITVGNERAFKYDMGNGYSVKVLTSIPSGQKYVRGEGSDSIKVILTDTADDLVDARPRTNRTPGYRERIIEKVKYYTECPEENCTGDVKVADGEYGKYFFCTEDDCEYMESVDKFD